MQKTIWSCTVEEDLAGLDGMIAGGVDIDSANDLGETCLHLAASRGLDRVAKILLASGANVHIKDLESGWTPLHRSLYFGHVRVSLMLLEAGAILDCERDKNCSKTHRTRSRSRSESVGSASKYPNSTNTNMTGCHRRSENLSDGDGNSPLDVLSLELRSQLKAAREMGIGGDVYSFGKADFFLGYDSFEKSDVVRPRRIEALANLQVVRVAASKVHSAAVTLDGKLFTWGHGRGGRLGHGNEDVCMLPTLVQGLANQAVVDVAASETHTAALTADGELYTWGRGRFGQLGHGPGSSGRLAPKRVEALRKVFAVGVAAGTEHTAVVTRSGVCYTWGRNNHGQLGLEGANQMCLPRIVSYLTSGASRGAGGMRRHVIKVSAAARSTVVVTLGVDKGSGLRPVNEVYQWGHGSHVPSRVKFEVAKYGKDGKDGGSSARWQTHDPRVDIHDVAAAKCHNLALSSVGQVFTWGFGADNLGLDPREARTARGPQLVAAMLPENCGGNAVYISASDQHSCVVTDTGDLYTWGASGEDGGALGLGQKRWQPFAKRVPSLKKVVSVAAAPDHTIVLLQASCPPLPHGAAFGSSDAQALDLKPYRKSSLGLISGQDEENEEGHTRRDSDSEDDNDADQGDKDVKDDDTHTLRPGLFTTDADGVSRPLTLKQHCEIVLARGVDLSNASYVLAYASALDAPGLGEYCADFVRFNLDGILVIGRESDRRCLLEASGVLTKEGDFSTSVSSPRLLRSVSEAGAGVTDGPMMIDDHEDEGIDRKAMEAALARAEMRAKTPSTKISAKAVRSLKKKIARIVELEALRDSGKQLSPEQVVKVDQKSRMEAELASLDSQLQRAKLAQAVRAQRIQSDLQPTVADGTPEESKDSLSAKRILFPEETHATETSSRKSSDQDEVRPQWTPQLDLSTPQLDLLTGGHQTLSRRRIKCEACRVECANSNMYAEHLRGKKHRATMARLERHLYDAAKSNTADSTVDVTTVAENSGARDGSRNDSSQRQRQQRESVQRGSPPQNSGGLSSQSSNTARSWLTAVDASQHDPSDESSAATPVAVAGAAKSSTKNPRWRDAPNRRRASYPDEMGGAYNEPRYIPNQLPRSSNVRVSMRQTLEMQQQVATAVIGNASKQDPTVMEAHAMSSLRSTTPTTSRETAPRRASIPEGPEDTTTRPAAHSLIDFMSAPVSKKPSTRKKPRENPGKTDHVWGADDDASAGAGTVIGRESQGPKSMASLVEEASEEASKVKSLHQIMEEEEEEKKEREEYGDSVWFVSRKPRSTSFESIIQQQKREELIAQEERKREAENRMDEELLQAVLEISRLEAQPSQSNESSQPSQRSSNKSRASTNRKTGRPRGSSKLKERAGLVGGATLPKTQRTRAHTVGGAAHGGSRAREGGSTNASSGGRSRHSKRAEGPRYSSTASDGATLKGKDVQPVEDIPRSRQPRERDS